MRLEVVLPDEVPAMPISALVDLAQQAEDLGYATAYLPDHILPPGEYGATFGGVYEPLVTIAHLGAVTRNLRFGTSVLVLPLRNPFVLAKQVASLQHLTAGRTVLGVGVGWVREEFAAVGAEFGRRGADTDDALKLIRHLWSGTSAPYAARRFGYQAGVFGPLPTTPIPILVGGNSDAALRRAATHADLWQGLPVPAEQFAERVAVLQELAAGRTVSPGLRIQWDDQRPLDRVLEEFASYREAGAEHLAVHFGDWTDYGSRMSALAEAASIRS